MNRRKVNITKGRFLSTPPETNILEFQKDLEEFHLYLVEVSFRIGNPIHLSVLATGFKTGSYWELWNNSGSNINLSNGMWPRYIKVIRPLGSLRARDLDA